MSCQTTKIHVPRTAILSVLLLAIFTSGFLRAEIHSHENTFPGHSHNVADQHDDSHDGEHVLQANPSLDQSGDRGALHMHESGAPALTLVPSIRIGVLAYEQADVRPLPPTISPPDNITTPLYRPPIA